MNTPTNEAARLAAAIHRRLDDDALNILLGDHQSSAHPRCLLGRPGLPATPMLRRPLDPMTIEDCMPMPRVGNNAAFILRELTRTGPDTEAELAAIEEHIDRTADDPHHGEYIDRTTGEVW